jgi:nucleoside-diphosphate-sugar epimerase
MRSAVGPPTRCSSGWCRKCAPPTSDAWKLSAASCSRSRSPVARRSSSSPRIVAITSVAVRVAVAVAGSISGPCASISAFIQSAAAASDGVVQFAFKHDIAFTGDFAGAAERDGLAPDPSDREVPISGANARIANADHALALAGRGVRSSVVRLPPATHGAGDNGFIPTAIGFARAKGAAAYVGDGANRWPAVHRDDAARLFRLALESAPPGSALHAVADEGVPLREVAEIFAAQLAIPAVSVTPAEAGDYVGWLGRFWATDGPASSQLTRDLLGWHPNRPGLIADLKQGHYFT